MDTTYPVIIDKSKKRQKKYLVCGIGIGILVAGILATVICVLIFSGDGINDKMDESDAAQMLEPNITNENITNENVFKAAFHVFDKDDDGYLNPSEFAHYYEIKLGRSKTFELIDVDNDNILSYPECVAFVKEMYKLEIVFERLLMHVMAPLVASTYNYKYNQSNKVEDELFIEYVAMLLFLQPYDIDKNGYIRHDEFILISSKTSFDIGDANSDNKLSESELFELFYGTEAEHSYKGVNKQLVGDSVNEVINAIHNIQINEEMVENAKERIQLCSSQLYAVNDELVRRRFVADDKVEIIIIIIII